MPLVGYRRVLLPAHDRRGRCGQAGGVFFGHVCAIGARERLVTDAGPKETAAPAATGLQID
jgi:hypothetical protein